MLNTFFLHGFTDIQTEVQTILVGEKEAVLAFVFRGRQDGPFMGIPPTQQEVAVPMVVICQMEEDGIKQMTLYYNAGTLLRQLGLA
jgi:predicted ester cyclase